MGTDAIGTLEIVDRPDLARCLPVEMRLAHASVYTMGHCRVIVTHDGTEGWHLSISCEDRDPTWSEIASARYRILPQVTEMVMHLPPLHKYVNIHKFTFHLYQLREGRS